MSSRNYSPKERAISVTIIHKMNSVTIYDIYSDPSKPPQTPIPLSNLLSSHKKSLCLNPPYELTYFDFDNDPVKIRNNEDYLSALAYARKNSLFQLKLFVLPPGFEEEPQGSIAIRQDFEEEQKCDDVEVVSREEAGVEVGDEREAKDQQKEVGKNSCTTRVSC
mmetsp:Transcript_8083/g.9173  ORF Transcript_8083/g.9173 Transcript_8083/m.9173 type:complete len:164 (-) Transcript_8083:364-855(-)